jgi:hypothetical protein
MFDVERYAKWFYIAWGLILLVGITGWFSGGKNGNLIFSDAITIIFVIMGIAFFLVKLPEIRHGREKVWKMREEEFARELEKIQKQSDLWDSLTKEKRMELCKELGVPSKYSKLHLIQIPSKSRKSLIFALNIEERRKSDNSERYNEYNANKEKKDEEGLDKYYYKLYCEPTDSFEKVKINYKRLSQRLHPDKLPPYADESTKKFANERFAELKDAFDKIEAQRS